MATNTGIRKCKECSKEFEKRYALQSYCSVFCEAKAKQGRHASKQYKGYDGKIDKISNTNTYTCSDGTRITSVNLEKMIRKAKQLKIVEMMDNYGYVFCEDCNEYGVPQDINQMDLQMFDCSHEISVDELKKSGRAELAADIDFIKIRCRHHHKKHDKLI